MILLKKQVVYKDKPYEVRLEESYNDYAYGYGDKIIELVLYEIKEYETWKFKSKDYKKVCKLNVTDDKTSYIDQINRLFKVYEVILCKEKEETKRLEEIEDWDGIIKGD